MSMEIKKHIIEQHDNEPTPPEIFKAGKQLGINRMFIKMTIDTRLPLSKIEGHQDVLAPPECQTH